MYYMLYEQIKKTVTSNQTIIALIALMLRRCDPCQLAEALSRAASSGEQPSLFRWQGHEVRGSRPALPKPFCTPRLPADTA